MIGCRVFYDGGRGKVLERVKETADAKEYWVVRSFTEKDEKGVQILLIKKTSELTPYIDQELFERTIEDILFLKEAYETKKQVRNAFAKWWKGILRFHGTDKWGA